MSQRRYWFRAIAFLPALMMLVSTIGAVSCGNGLYGVGSSGSPTATPTTTGGTFGYVTGFASGKIVEFSRNLTTGALKQIATITVGSSNGPKGIAITPGAQYLYATNYKDGTIYEFAIGSDGKLTPIGSGTVSDGSNSGPDELAINPAGTYLFVSDFLAGTITTWVIGTGGALGIGSTLKGLNSPFGMVVNSTGTILYASDYTTGLIYAFTINSSGQLNQLGQPVQNLGVSSGNPGLMALDPAGSYLYVDDLTSGVVSIFYIANSNSPGQVFFQSTQPTALTPNLTPIGIGVAQLGTIGNYLLTANQGIAGGGVWAFPLTFPGTLSPPVQYGSVNGPTGLAIDPQNRFAYTTNIGDGTIAVFGLSCGTNPPTPVCQLPLLTIPADKTTGSNTQPFGIALTP